MPSKLFLPKHVIQDLLMTFTVKAPNGREQTVVIPKTGDKGEDEYLKQAYTEKTITELMKSPALYQRVKKVSKEDTQGALREYQEWKNKRK